MHALCWRTQVTRTVGSIALAAALGLCGCAAGGTTPGASEDAASEAPAATEAAQQLLPHRFATASEGKEALASNDAYFAGFSQNDLDYRMQKKGATLEEYKAFAVEQVRDFTDEEKALIDKCFNEMADTLEKNGYKLPSLDEVVLVKTTMAEECDAGGYTHGTTIYLGEYVLQMCLAENPQVELDLSEILWHELFHCLTRSNADFRADMYKLIHFTVHDKDYTLPQSVMDYHISNPDVEHHDSSATFRIDGKDVECFTDYVTTKHFEKEGDNFFDSGTTALVPVDGTDSYYTPDQAENFDEVFGRNTDYVIDPEECMADNFSYAMAHGAKGLDGKGYETPEIIEGILEYVSR